MNNLISIGKCSFLKCQKHKHSNWEIVYYTKGRGINKIGEQDVPFKPGKIICQPPEVPHQEKSENGYEDIYFCVNKLNLYRNYDKHIIFFDNSNQNFLSILKLMYQEFHIKKDNWQNIVNSLLNVLFQYLHSWEEKQKNTFVEDLKMIFIQYIGENDVKIKNILDELPYSNNYIRTQFKKKTGYTPLEYLTVLRINHAKNLLNQNSNMNIGQIASLVGYRDALYFSKIFKNYTNYCPTEWRKLKNK